MAALFFFPLIALVQFSLSGQINPSARQFVYSFALAEATINTSVLVAISIIVANAYALTLSLLHRFSNLSYKKVLFVLAVLPLAIPLYVYAFIFMGAFEYGAALPSLLRASSGLIINTQNIFFVGFIFGLALSPYCFLFYYSGLSRLNRNSLLAASSLGAKSCSMLRYIVLPHLKPHILSASVLVALEVICDFGAVSIFNLETYSIVVYGAWESFFSLEAAGLLSLAPIVLGLILFFLLESSRLREEKNTVSRMEKSTIELIKFNYPAQVLAWTFVGASFALSVGFPLLQLLLWTLETSIYTPMQSFLDYALNTLIIGTTVAVSVTVLSVVISYIDRNFMIRAKSLFPLLQLGYAIPGSIFAVACISSFSLLRIEHSGRLALFLLLFALAVRFFAANFQQVTKQFSSISKELDNATMSLGARPLDMFRFIHFPQIKRALLLGLVFVFLEVAKEIPITLILRPFGWNTFATKIYELTSEGEWERASLPALFLVLLGSLSLVVYLAILRNSERHENA